MINFIENRKESNDFLLEYTPERNLFSSYFPIVLMIKHCNIWYKVNHLLLSSKTLSYLFHWNPFSLRCFLSSSYSKFILLLVKINYSVINYKLSILYLSINYVLFVLITINMIMVKNAFWYTFQYLVQGATQHLLVMSHYIALINFIITWIYRRRHWFSSICYQRG